MIAIACDHAGTEMKNEIKKLLDEKKLEYTDFGPTDSETAGTCDYPVVAARTASAVASGQCDRGILICGTGIGVSLAANKVKGIRCALCCEPYSAAMSREHNNCNMIALGARVVGVELAKATVTAWLETSFLGERHERRVDQITQIENDSAI